MRSLSGELFPVTLILIDDQSVYDSIVKRVQGKNAFTDVISFPSAGTAHTTAIDGTEHGLIVVVTLGDFSEQPRDYTNSILTHEAVHVWQFVAKAIGEKKAGYETEAYAIQYYARYLIDEFTYRENKRAKMQENSK